MNNFDPTILEEALCGALKAWGVSDVVYNARPKSAPKVNDFAVVRVRGSIQDVKTYGKGTISVSLYAKDIDNMKNGKKLSWMYRKLTEGLPVGFKATEGETLKGAYLLDPNPTILGDLSDDFGFHTREIQIGLIIKVI